MNSDRRRRTSEGEERRGHLFEPRRVPEGQRQLDEVLQLRLEQMVDAVETAHGKILHMSSSPAFADLEAGTQVTVLVDSLLLEIEQLGACVVAVGDAFKE